MSKTSFAESLGATCVNPRFAWSYINEDKRFILFGAWKHHEVGASQRIFSLDWRRNPLGNKNKGFTLSNNHIDRILEDGFDLYTFSMTAKPGTEQGVAKTLSYEEKPLLKSLRVDGRDYWAEPLPIEADREQETASKVFFEGDSREVRLTRYERNAEARRECLKEHGVQCVGCGFDFEKSYGERGRGFIHVHHLVPVSERKTSYQINPVSDLRPLCPNCHAIVHRGPKMLSVEELVLLVSKFKK